MDKKQINSISIDVEEHFHANNLNELLPPCLWHKQESRVVSMTDRVLELLEKHEVQATFFILGYVARRNPKLVKKISEAGHEIASHGYSHQLAYTQSKKTFYRDVYKAKSILEDISGQKVLGYRAPSFSIKEENSWAYEKLIEAGYQYDSSLYPIWHPRYANSDKPVVAHKRKTALGEITICPLAVYETSVLGKKPRFPVAGGAYWRILPWSYILWGLNNINRNHPFHTYFHPWEIDTDKPEVEGLSRITKFRHNYGTGRLYNKIDTLLGKYEFAPIKDIIKSLI